jgi:alpha-tubulin suppressor-like RCC1 family protein
MTGRICALAFAVVVLVAPAGPAHADGTKKPAFTAFTPPATARVGESFAYQFKATGTPKPTFSRATGALPPGLHLSVTGRLAGEPTAAGVFRFRVRATNAAGSTTTASRTVTASHAWKRVSTGDFHTCAVTTAGAAMCWGFNGAGQLGNGTKANHTKPVQVSGLQKGVVAISAGGNHTCALTKAGAVKCWGFNQYGQLGNGTTTSRSTPVAVAGLSGVVAISVGGNDSCALTQSGAMKCWGRGTEGQLGNGLMTNSLVPVPVTGLTSGVTAIALGFDHTCAVANGAARCWGFNLSGEVGDGSNTLRSTPAPVSGLTSGVVRIAAGHAHTCAVVSGGAARCWGYGGHGALGNGATSNSNTPVPVSTLTSGTTAVDAGLYQSCAVVAGTAKCWGGKSGSPSLGNGSNAASSTPVAVSGLASGVVAISAGGKNAPHTCAVTSTAGLKCWGDNTYGQLGDGTKTGRASPVTIL